MVAPSQESAFQPQPPLDIAQGFEQSVDVVSLHPALRGYLEAVSSTRYPSELKALRRGLTDLGPQGVSLEGVEMAIQARQARLGELTVGSVGTVEVSPPEEVHAAPEWTPHGILSVMATRPSGDDNKKAAANDRG